MKKLAVSGDKVLQALESRLEYLRQLPRAEGIIKTQEQLERLTRKYDALYRKPVIEQLFNKQSLSASRRKNLETLGKMRQTTFSTLNSARHQFTKLRKNLAL